MQCNNVVPQTEPLSETQFRNQWLIALARMCRDHGDDKVAMWLGVSERHLRNIKGGSSLPTADKIWGLLARDRTAHDEMNAAYGLKTVTLDSVCTNDPLTLDMIAVSHEVAEHEHQDSHGGTVTTDHELLKKDEARLRRVHGVIGSWIYRLDKMRGARRFAVVRPGEAARLGWSKRKAKA